MIKDLLVPITNTAGDDNAVAAAMALATRQDAHLAVLEIVNLPVLPTSDATRALHDALPLLRAARSVDLLQIDPPASDKDEGAQPCADIATHLARHGLKVPVVVHARAGGTVVAALLSHAQQSGAELLVAGGYGHTRFREWLLGGVTRELLQSTSMPVLFSH